jgi:hypothetical protein
MFCLDVVVMCGTDCIQNAVSNYASIVAGAPLSTDAFFCRAPTTQRTMFK